ncbi:MAG: hypothetical protein R3A48_03430 [Polyangiales bacterium]
MTGDGSTAALAAIPARGHPHRDPMLRAVTPLFAAAFLCAATARAQCDAGTPIHEIGTLQETFPADLGTEVPTDGLIRLRYLERPPEPATVCLRRRDRDGCVEGRASIIGDEVVWQALAPLEALTDYVATFSDTVGGSNLIRFRTGTGLSSTPPRFGGLTSATLAGAPEDLCDPGAVDVTVRFERAQRASAFGDVGWPDTDIEYVLYITRGAGVSGPRVLERARVQGSGFAGDRSAQRTVRVPGAYTSGPLCLTMLAVDPSGRDDGNRVERCVNPSLGNYFAGCSTSPAPRRGRAGWLLALSTLLVARRRFSRRGRV